MTADEEALGLDEDSGKQNVSEQIRQAIIKGATREELVEAGFNKNSVRTIYSELKTKGLLPKKSMEVMRTERQPAQTYQKGAPPEILINAIEMPIKGGDQFEAGMKFGMSLVVLGVRVAQELSQAGVQQAKPLLDLARDMRRGEAEAARSAASEAASAAAEEVGTTIAPALATLLERTRDGSSQDPMRSMMADVFKPMLKHITGAFFPGGQPDDNVPSGWTRKKE